MTLLLLPFSSERTCVWACMCVVPCAEAEENPHNCFWGQKKQTHGFICYNNKLATLESSSLKSLFLSCYTSLLLLSVSLVLLSRAGFQTYGPLYCATVGFTQVSLSCPFIFWPLAPLTCGTCSSFSFFLPSFPLVFILSDIQACFHCFTPGLNANLAWKYSHATSGVISLLLPFPLPC